MIRTLESDPDLPKFQFIEINGMRLTEPNQTYVQLWKALTQAKVTTEHAKNLLEKRFTAANAETSKKQQATVVLIDELDLLWNRKQSVLYNIFEWPTNKYAKLIVLAIANTMDLPVSIWSSDSLRKKLSKCLKDNIKGADFRLNFMVSTMFTFW